MTNYIDHTISVASTIDDAYHIAIGAWYTLFDGKSDTLL